MQTNNDRWNQLLKETGADSDTSEKIRQAARENPAVAKALNHLTESDMAGITAILNDKQALRRLMSTPKAQALMKKLKS